MTRSKATQPKRPTKPAKPKLVAMPDGEPSDRWTTSQLCEWAKVSGLDLAGARLKGEILELVLAIVAPDEPVTETLLEATDRSIAKAIAEGILDAELHAGPIATLRILARKIDTEDELRDAALDWAAEHDSKKTPAKPPPIDNVSIPTYRNYCESLGLTVGVKAGPAKGGAGGGEDGKPKSKLGQLRSVHTAEGA